MSRRPRKRFGQHFLHDPEVVARIVRSIAPADGGTVVEIGPGRGVLTSELAKVASRLIAVEIDRDLAADLGVRYAGLCNVEIHEADILKTHIGQFGESLCLVGNLPYNISTPLIFHITRQRRSIANATFMLQKEVVDRMAAAPGSKTYGRLSVMVQACWQVDALFDVEPGAFSPPPKVRSAVLRMTPLAESAGPGCEGAFAEVVRRAFGQRRKTLRNALDGLIDAEAIEAAGIDPGARAEVLTVRQFIDLSDRIPDKIAKDRNS